ncbi:MAG: hypothetical protein HDR02_03580 [Lachnospiraceae bacterium]|nr:hypothetical protein [Lachnospiraceae bacterium]
MDKKVTGIVAYISIIGWLIAFLAGDKEGAKFHLNQALIVDLGMLICTALTRIPLIGLIFWLVNIFLFVCWLIGLIAAIKEEDKEIPLIGAIKILK